SQQPCRGRIDGHRRVHLCQGDLVEQLGHVVDVADRHPDLADLSGSHEVVRVVPGLSRKIESDAETGLSLRKVPAKQLVCRARVGVPGVRPHQPRFLALSHVSTITSRSFTKQSCPDGPRPSAPTENPSPSPWRSAPHNATRWSRVAMVYSLVETK